MPQSMHRTLAYLLTSTLLALGSTGCAIYFDDPDDDDCLYGGSDVPQGGLEAPAPGLRNPFTGQCEFFDGGGGGGGCDSACGPCEPPPPTIPIPTWGFCDSSCSGLDQATCSSTPGCRGAYLTSGVFSECWAVDMTGPVQGGACEGLDAWECSRHDDCVAIHVDTCSTSPAGDLACGTGEFVACGAEAAGCFVDQECQPGYRCNATEVCGLPPGCGSGDPNCDAACYGYCVPVEDPGQCYGEVLCDALPPECPPDRIPGRRDGCWTGQCILVNECEPPTPLACEDITDEQACIGRADCSALYEGSNCTCDAAGACTCMTWTFTHCATR